MALATPARIVQHLADMKVLVLERTPPGVPDDACKPHLRAEARRAWELHQAAVIRELYFRADSDSAVLVLECADADEARRALETLPLVERGLIAFDLIPLRPYPGFGRLLVGGD
jgi:hypothetical protein